MCRVFVLAKETPHPDPSLDHLRHKRGDICDILDDGVHGGKFLEENPGLVRILELPGVDKSELAALLATDMTPNPNTGYLPRLRINRIDIDKIEAIAKPTTHDKTIAFATKADLLKHHVLVPHRLRPNIIGHDRMEIG